jgi:hypothetical protein
MLPTRFRFIWQSGFRGGDFLEINQSQTRIVCGGQKIAHFVTIRYQTWLPQTIPVSDWLISRKPLGQMNRNRKLVGIIYGRISIKIVNFVPIR